MSTKGKTPTIQAELKELEDIASWFEKEADFDVEVGLEKVKRGAVLVHSLRDRLRAVENEFREIEADLGRDESS